MATLDQVYQLLGTVNRKLDTLIAEGGILMSQQDDLGTELAQDTQLLQAEIAALNDNWARLNTLVEQLEAGQGKPVDPGVLAGFREAVAGLKPAVDRISSVGLPDTPA